MNKFGKQHSGFGTATQDIQLKMMELWENLIKWAEQFGNKSKTQLNKLRERWNELVNNQQPMSISSPIVPYRSPAGTTPIGNIDLRKKVAHNTDDFYHVNNRVNKTPTPWSYITEDDEVLTFGQQLQPTYEIMGPVYNSYYN